MKQTTTKRSRITGEARVQLGTELKAAYDKGASVRQLAAEIGRSYGTTHLLLAESGVTFRNRGGQTGRTRQRS